MVAAVAAAVAVALFGRSSRSALLYLIKRPMVVCAFGSKRAYAVSVVALMSLVSNPLNFYINN